MQPQVNAAEDKKLLDKKAFIVFVTYLILGLSWIYFTDWIVFTTADDSRAITELQTQKGFFYVIGSALIIYFLITYLNTKLTSTSESFYELFRAHPSAMLIISNPSGQIIKANKSAQKLFVSESSLESTIFANLISDLDSADKELVEAFQNSDQDESKIVKFDLESGTIYLNVHYQGSIDASPELELVVLNEVSSTVNYLQEKQELILLLRGYAQATSHNIRRPLSNILGLSELLNEKGLESEIAFEALKHLYSSAKELDEELQKVSEKSANH